MLLSGAYGSGPVLLSAAPLTASSDPASPERSAGFPSIPTPAADTAATDGSSSPVATTKPANAANRPAFVDIPAIGATSTVDELGTLADGRLETPNDFMKVGWWAGGTVPGEVGPAVLAGHLDSYQGPAIFARLNQLKPDDLIRVARRDGQVLTFSVTRVDRYPKDLFPAAQVYGATPTPELRLITCGGTFDHSAHSYKDNTVVYARLVTDATTTSV